MIVVKLTQAEFDQLAAKLEAEEGMQLAGTAGTLQKNGVTATWSFDGSQLQIQVTHTPFMIGHSFAEGKIREAIAEYGYVAE